MLTPDVLELSLNVDWKIEVIPWQYAILVLKDFDWEFKRSYSVVQYKDWILTFAIKIKDIWRWWRTLSKIKVWEIIKIQWIYWNFVLKYTNNPKVFIATWTWLSPIINMLDNENLSKEKYLLFWVQTEKDLFYTDKLKKNSDTKISIFLSKEEKKDYNYWRLDITKYSFPKNSEFYICWNPQMVVSCIESLEKMAYKNIYFEKF